MQARDWTQEELADSIPTTQSNVSRWLGGREPRGGNMERIRELALESGVIEREPVSSNQAPLMGRVGAGAQIDDEYEQPPPEGYDMVELPFSYPDPILAFEVEGDSQLPVYEPGEVIVCLREQVRSTDHFVGEKVIVRISTGQRYLKRLARGSLKGMYNLESWNALTIENVRVEWIGEIIGSVNRSAIRRIERRHQQAKAKAKGPAKRAQP